MKIRNRIFPTIVSLQCDCILQGLRCRQCSAMYKAAIHGTWSQNSHWSYDRNESPFSIRKILYCFLLLQGPVRLRSGCTVALGLMCSPKYSIQHRFSNPVPRMKRQSSLTEAVLMSFGSTINFPKTL